jgi:hypothetical protein
MFQLGFGVLDEEASPTPLFNASVDFRQIKQASLKIGTIDHRQFVFSSLNNNLTTFALAYAELNVYREIGIQLHADKPIGGFLRYAAEVAGGKSLLLAPGPEPAGATTPVGLLFLGRFVAEPFGEFDSTSCGDQKRTQSPRLAIGGGGAYNHHTIYPLSNAIFPGMTTFAVPFSYIHGFSNLMFKWQGFSVVGEAYYRRATEISHIVPTTGAVEYSRNAWGWYAQAGMMITSKLELESRVGGLYQLARPAALGPQSGPPYILGGVEKTVADMRDVVELTGGASYYIDGHVFKVQAEYAEVLLPDFTPWTGQARLLLTLAF